MTAQTDIAVIGAGPAGMNAALAAAELGLKVSLIDAYRQAGGHYFKQMPPEFRATATTQRQKQAELIFGRLSHPNITLLTGTQVWGIYEGNLLTLFGPQAPPQLQANAVILATGAYDRPVAFPGWTLPGVMTAGAAQTLLKSQRVLPGRRILVAGSGPLPLALGAALVWAGAEVTALLEGSPQVTRFGRDRLVSLWGQWSRLTEAAQYGWALLRARVPTRLSWGVVQALGTERDAVEGAVIAKLDASWRPIAGSEQIVDCDTICLGYGFVPSTELCRLAGAQHTYQPRLGGWTPLRDQFMQTTIPGLYAAGDGAGIGGAAQATIEGRIAAVAAAQRCRSQAITGEELAGLLATELSALRREKHFQRLYGELFTPGPGLDELATEETIICRCEAIRLAQVIEAVALGADTVSAVKNLTRTGMGECQGRLCGPLVASQVARLCAKNRQAVGPFTPRPPIHPLPLGAVAGGEYA
jgi:NADPH-dependent 2,4-dienoyl-CoA reductase/sulfur reductase-like enzyme